MTAREVGRAGVRKMLQRTGIIAESTTALATDQDEVTQLLSAPWYDDRLQRLAKDMPVPSVEDETLPIRGVACGLRTERCRARDLVAVREGFSIRKVRSRMESGLFCLMRSASCS